MVIFILIIDRIIITVSIIIIIIIIMKVTGSDTGAGGQNPQNTFDPAHIRQVLEVLYLNKGEVLRAFFDYSKNYSSNSVFSIPLVVKEVSLMRLITIDVPLGACGVLPTSYNRLLGTCMYRWLDMTMGAYVHICMIHIQISLRQL